MSTDPKPVPENIIDKDYKPRHSPSHSPASYRKAGIATGITALVSAVAVVTFTGAAGLSEPIEAVPAPVSTTTPLQNFEKPYNKPSLVDERSKLFTTPTPSTPTLNGVTAADSLIDEADEKRMMRAAAAEASPEKTVSDDAGFTAAAGAAVVADAPRVIAPEDRLAWPIKDHGLSSNFGFRSDPFTHEKRFHTGLDMGGACGTPIFAAEDGVVEAAGNTHGGYGIRIVVKHRADLSTTYNHLQEIQVKAGQKLKLGDKIGLMGTTGRSTGCHLHFEVIKDGYMVSPWSWLTGKPDAVATKVKVGSVFTVSSPASSDKVTKTSTPTSTPTTPSKPPVTPTTPPTITPTSPPKPPVVTPPPTPTTPPATPTTPTSTPTPTTPPPSTPTTPPASPSPSTPPSSSPEPTTAPPSSSPPATKSSSSPTTGTSAKPVNPSPETTTPSAKSSTSSEATSSPSKK